MPNHIDPAALMRRFRLAALLLLLLLLTACSTAKVGSLPARSGTAAMPRPPVPGEKWSRKVIDPTKPSKGTVVLVHGIFGCGRQMAPIAEFLEARGYQCLTPELTPSGAGLGLRDLALKLDGQIKAGMPPSEHFAMIAYSMGGLVSRDYLQNLGGAPRCKRFFTLSTPHHGTLVGNLYWGQGAWEMRRNSEFLRQLNASEGLFGKNKIPATSYRTPLDLVIVPSTSSDWDVASNLVDWQLAHPLMPHSTRIQKDILRRMEGNGDSIESDPLQSPSGYRQ